MERQVAEFAATVTIAMLTLASLLAIPQNVSAQVPVEVVHAFNGGGAPHLPMAPVIEASDGNFYGTTAYGGAYMAGTVFRMTPSGVVTFLHDFNGTDGAAPAAPLFQASDGNFYGSAGGKIFKMTPGGEFTVLCSIRSSGLVQGTDGALYRYERRHLRRRAVQVNGRGMLLPALLLPKLSRARGVRAGASCPWRGWPALWNDPLWRRQ